MLFCYCFDGSIRYGREIEQLLSVGPDSINDNEYKKSTKGPDYGQVDIKVFNWRGRRNGVSHFSAFLFLLTHYSPPLNRQIAFVFFSLTYTEKDKTTRLYSIYASPKVRKKPRFLCLGACALARSCDETLPPVVVHVPYRVPVGYSTDSTR